ncbi:MAG: helix-turn-helix transcriptional regulator [Bacilli bacterium]|nr:helix-turn-helix transcriptional regulator [Bacilli bacterium]
MNVGARIKKHREKQNISQDELALKVFVSRQTISNWETNKSYPDIKSLTMLSNIFHVTLDDFIKRDIKEMKRIVSKEKIEKFNIMSYIFLAEMLIVMFSAYPLFSLDGYIGVIIWALFFVITFITATIIEKFKKNNDIQTYKEIITFMENKSLSYEEVQQEIGKRNYQKILLAILAGLITFIIFIIEIFIIKKI